MSNDAGTSAPEGGQDTAGAGGGQAAATATAPDTSAAADWNADDWRAFADEVGLSPGEVKKRLGHARTWEDRAKANKGAVEQAQTLQQQLEQLRFDLADRDQRDIERAGRLAMTQVRSALAEAGIKPDDVKDLLDEFDPLRLLKDGEPNDEAIGRIVGALRRTAGRPSADPDQGQRGDGAPQDMNALIRRAAGRG
jgi:hypothetical protein